MHFIAVFFSIGGISGDDLICLVACSQTCLVLLIYFIMFCFPFLWRFFSSILILVGHISLHSSPSLRSAIFSLSLCKPAAGVYASDFFSSPACPSLNFRLLLLFLVLFKWSGGAGTWLTTYIYLCGWSLTDAADAHPLCSAVLLLCVLLWKFFIFLPLNYTERPNFKWNTNLMVILFYGAIDKHQTKVNQRSECANVNGVSF